MTEAAIAPHPRASDTAHLTNPRREGGLSTGGGPYRFRRERSLKWRAPAIRNPMSNPARVPIEMMRLRFGSTGAVGRFAASMIVRVAAVETGVPPRTGFAWACAAAW